MTIPKNFPKYIARIHWVDFDVLKKYRIVNSQKEKNIISPIRKENDCTNGKTQKSSEAQEKR